MSFLSSSECAVGANPLAQLSKQSNADQSMQRSAVASAQAGSMDSQSRLRQPVMMNERDRMEMEKFHSGSVGSSFNMQPMAREIERMQTDPERLLSNKEMMGIKANAAQQGFSWTTEFVNQPMQAGGSEQSMNDQRHAGPGPSMRYPFQSSFMQRPMMGSSAMMHSAPLQASSSAAQVVDWEESFKEIEDLQEVEDTVDAHKSALDQAYEGLQQAAAAEQKNLDEYAAKWPAFDEYAASRANYGDYKFEEENKFMKMDGAYEIGCRLMESGARLSEAALAFEAAVKENPQHIDAWLKLGQVQIQNEKELVGIAALEKCLDLSPQNLPALMGLAISYVNEGYDNAAYATLERWIETKYPEVVRQAKTLRQADEDKYTLNKRITELFLKAAQLSPTGANVDADVQTGLGVLFYSLEEYDKTLDCFRAAIRCNPKDALSWNRLGASLANDNRSEQAIEAYTKALQLNPNFVRARYNLGVSFINMGMHKNAVDQLLTGLSMHEVEGGGNAGSSQSTGLLETLKRALIAMDRRDLVVEVKQGMNIDEFRKKGGF